MAPCNRMHVCKGAWHLCCAGCECVSILKVITCTHTCVHSKAYATIHTYIQTHSYTSYPAFLPSVSPVWLTVPAPARDYGGKRGGGVGLGLREGWRGLRPEQGRVRKRAGGLGPLSFINLNVYTSWSPAMRPFSFPQVSASRICRPFLHSFSPGEAAKTPLPPLITAGISDKSAVRRLYQKAKKF